jgi:cytosine/adenosine deaminase-related metal-dependent hydrolase
VTERVTDAESGTLEGTILRGSTFEPVEGRVVWEDGEVTAVEEADVVGDRIVMPAFVNAHTHIGDSIAKEAGEGLTLEELVAPPDGLKHRLLRGASQDELVAGMERTFSYMARAGTAAHVEFREGGVEGVEAIERASAESPVESVVLGRETVEAMEHSDGFGASGANDADFARERNATRRAGKLFGIHAGEVDETDINPALDLDPDFLVHMVHAEGIHLERLADSRTPVVACPRSNAATGVGLPPLRALAERTTVALGTDNVMLNGPTMFREMEWAAKLADLPATDVLAMATKNGASIADLNCGVIEPGRDAKLIALDGNAANLAGVRDIVRGVVRRATVDDVERVVL